MYVTKKEVKKLIQKELFAVRELIAANPEVNTKLACKMLNVNRNWLSKNRHLFKGRVINRRGDLRFSTLKIIQFKKQGIEAVNFKE